ncbi:MULTISPECIES: acetyl-CoA hydrolase/transferase C-terminal domain-containing protein [Mycobacterium avium complex (MAC)]|jgi:acyl-CoA hydrolase|uniref:Acetyl-CoA hydrolase n=2 Tax=Mycobacterium avium complex (MAC) TaxID=120793 RepID=A0AAW5S5V9_MYCBC|nr:MULTISPECIES: acetyl-CoA hydrolase/transferase C-terminal domain-containing protein [Mycobacterium avium complex (MAC)]ETZ43883.1 citrate lyase, alpha subunit family protein [Mycobacterium avium MAV_061107_1842]MBG0729529.1 acetyl-CoA hydrolase [Mycobacterium avium]MBZ4502980.1 acetyl-CoA hydrolase [Mycobacterium avium subsp. hominissuis]MBZ4520530.1 acetyl-CoA hydrolase [Mycobacterium avium subsp. hominissuis]MBZ4532344.1 acetyl-CoA hydrolase [Mycobacterium avium subsp. hominissuis]
MTEPLTAAGLTAALRAALRPGMTVALGDGVGALRCLDDGGSVGAALSVAAREVGSVRLMLGWLPAPVDGLDADAFAEVVALMPGWGVREVLRSPKARFLPTRLAAIPALLADVLRPDVLLTRVVRRDGLLQFGTEVSWQRELIDGGTKTLAILDTSSPAADAGPALDPSGIEVLGTVGSGPVRVPQREPEAIHDALADAVLQLIPQGASIQYGPGLLGTALLRRTQVPLRVDTGLLTDAVVDLDRRGLLVGTPSATYLLGSESLYDWADGRPVLRGLDYTHNLSRLSRGAPLVAVNTAIEIDQYGQINVEGVRDKVIGGIGGHPDYCAAARLSSGGLSIIAVPTRVNGSSPLVEQLSRPVSTPAHDVDLIVTESGHVDLRAADWSQRRALIAELFAA